MKILIMGAGGVGGYIAGRLAAKNDEITLIARGATLDAIRSKGLILSDVNGRYVSTPSLVTDKPEEAGIVDAIIFAVKSYGLVDAVEKLKPCIGEHTLLIPLLNGISARRIIHEHTDRGVALDGCVYIFSKILEPGVIEKTGTMCRIVTGNPDGAVPDALHALASIMGECGVTMEISDDISRVMWTKWLIMCSNAQAASYYNLNIGPMRDDKEKFAIVPELIDEVLLVAKAEGINMPDDAKEKTLALIETFEYDSAPSFSRDLNTPGKPTELSIFAGELCRLADKHGIDVPKNRMILEHFKDRL